MGMGKNRIGKVEWIQTVPSNTIFEVRKYINTDYVLVLFDKNLYEQLKSLCNKEGVRVEDALYTGILYVKKRLGGE